jgi:hypothetical protein
MSRKFSSLILAASLLGIGSFALAQPAPQPAGVSSSAVMEPAMEEAVKRDLPGFKVEPVQQKRINGVKVGWLKVTDAHGSSLIAITEFGDFFSAATHHGPRNLPAPVDAVINRLFAGRPTEVMRYVSTQYQIVVETDGKRDMLIFDAVGKLSGIAPNVQSAVGDAERPEENLFKSGDALSVRMEELAKKRLGADAQVQQILRDRDSVDFYTVVVHTPSNNRIVDLVTNGSEVYSRRESLRERDVPAPIIAAVTEQFKTSKIFSRHRRTYEFYEFADKTSDGDVISVRITTNGVVTEVGSKIAVRERQLIEEAQQAR